jgi:glycosyltransferase involved in cell wall biosynthesis
MMDTRRVLYVEMAHGMGGSLVSLLQLVRGLDRSRYEPVVLFYWDNPFVERFRELGIEVIVWSPARQESDSTVPIPLPTAVERPKRWFAKYGWLATLYHAAGYVARFLFQTLPLAWRLRRVIKEQRIDLLHANDLLTSNREVVIAARMTDTPCICHVRAFERYGALDRFLAPYVDRFIFISQAIEQDSVNQGADATKGVVIYNALDMAEFLEPHDAEETRRSLGLSPTDAVVGIMGRIIPWKGHRTFIEAMALVAKTIPQLRCLIVGDAAPADMEYKDELIDLAAEFGIAERVQFLGWRQDVPRLLGAMDLLVHASLEPEPFGRVLIEGMAAGKPVIASDSGACPEIVRDGVSGILATPGDARDLAQAAAALLSNPDRIRTMGVVARHEAEARFSIDEHVRRVQSVYAELVSATTSAL